MLTLNRKKRFKTASKHWPQDNTPGTLHKQRARTTDTYNYHVGTTFEQKRSKYLDRTQLDEGDSRAPREETGQHHASMTWEHKQKQKSSTPPVLKRARSNTARSNSEIKPSFPCPRMPRHLALSRRNIKGSHY